MRRTIIFVSNMGFKLLYIYLGNLLIYTLAEYLFQVRSESYTTTVIVEEFKFALSLKKRIFIQRSVTEIARNSVKTELCTYLYRDFYIPTGPFSVTKYILLSNIYIHHFKCYGMNSKVYKVTSSIESSSVIIFKPTALSWPVIGV